MGVKFFFLMHFGSAQGRQETKKSRLTKIIRLPLASLVRGDKVSFLPAQKDPPSPLVKLGTGSSKGDKAIKKDVW